MMTESLKYITVKQLNMYVKSLLTSDPNLSPICVRGEISNYTRNSRSGHAYFTLKDMDAAVKVVMFSSYADGLEFVPSDGKNVILFGKVTLYERDGAYQLNAEAMIPTGIGDAYLSFIKLKDKLSKEGIFDDKYKKQIPKYPNHIGVITSITGAALHDILSVCERRYTLAQIDIMPCSVQGNDCTEDVKNALTYFNNEYPVDVIIIARGGGSYEDLACFNDEKLAREIFLSKIPIISAIGHETDFTIVDFVADMRAPTPSAAAEIATPSMNEMYNYIKNIKHQCSIYIKNYIENEYMKLDLIKNKFNTEVYIKNNEDKLYDLQNNIFKSVKNIENNERLKLEGIVNCIEACNPLSVLKRGYGIVSNDKGLVKTISDINIGSKITIRLKDGEIYCATERTEKF